MPEESRLVYQITIALVLIIFICNVPSVCADVGSGSIVSESSNKSALYEKVTESPIDTIPVSSTEPLPTTIISETPDEISYNSLVTEDTTDSIHDNSTNQTSDEITSNLTASFNQRVIVDSSDINQNFSKQAGPNFAIKDSTIEFTQDTSKMLGLDKVSTSDKKLGVPKTVKKYKPVTFDQSRINTNIRSGSHDITIQIDGLNYVTYLKRMNFESIDDGIDSYSGTLVGEKDSSVILTISENATIGSVRHNNETYYIEPVVSPVTGKPLHIIYNSKDLDDSKIQIDNGPIYPNCNKPVTGLNYIADSLSPSQATDSGTGDMQLAAAAGDHKVVYVRVFTDNAFITHQVPVGMIWQDISQGLMAQVNDQFERDDIGITISPSYDDDAVLRDTLSNHSLILTDPLGAFDAVYPSSYLDTQLTDVGLYLGGNDAVGGAQGITHGFPGGRRTWAQMVKDEPDGLFPGDEQSRLYVIAHELGHFFNLGEENTQNDGKFNHPADFDYGLKHTLMYSYYIAPFYAPEFSSSAEGYHGELNKDNARMMRLTKNMVSHYQECPLSSPASQFTWQPNSPPPTIGTTIQFRPQEPANAGEYWDWNFGDGTGSILQSPAHVYVTGGTYPVTLKTYNCEGTSQKTLNLLVTEPPSNERVQSGDGGSTTNWNTEGSSTGGGAWSPAHVVTSGGVDNTPYLQLDINSGSGSAHSEMYQDIILTNVNTITYNLKKISSSGRSNSIEVWLDSTKIKTINNPSQLTTWTPYSYSVSGLSGTHRIQFYSYTSGGSWLKTGVDSVSAMAIPPVANIMNITPRSGTAPLTVQFYDASMGNPSSWFWIFGDGNTSTARNAGYTYPNTGSYNVTLIVSNSAGPNTTTQTNYITVTPPPLANFTASPTSGTAPLTVTFTDTSPGSPTSWSWNFGDGNTTNGVQNPVHTYLTNGSFTVRLNATNAVWSNTTTKTNYITVTPPPPLANFTASSTSGIAPLTVRFTDISTGSPTSWSWNFGDGNTTNATAQNPVHTYIGKGVFSVSVNVTNMSSGSNLTTQKDFIKVGVLNASIGVFRNSHDWYLDRNKNCGWDGNTIDRHYGTGEPGSGLGLPNDIPITGDWNGDGKTEIGVFRSGQGWYLDYNDNGFWDNETADRRFGLGKPNDTPVTGDWNGDGKTEIGVFRCGQGWYLDYNGNGFWDNETADRRIGVSQPNDIPVTGDWNGDGKTEIGVFRSEQGWYLDYNGNGFWDNEIADRHFRLGQPNDIPVTADWNGDGKTEIGVFRSPHDWYLDYNGNGFWDNFEVDVHGAIGQPNDIPVTGIWG